MRSPLPLTPLLALSSLCSLSIALPFISRPNNSRSKAEPVMVARAAYSVVPVDGGSQWEPVTVTQTIAASASAVEVYITVTAPAAVTTETVTGAAKEFKTVYIPTTVYAPVATPTAAPIASSVGGNSTIISTVTLSSSVSAPSSTKVYDNGVWHTTYPVWSNSTTTPTQGARR